MLKPRKLYHTLEEKYDLAFLGIMLLLAIFLLASAYLFTL
jgi:hypothetical protein